MIRVNIKKQGVVTNCANFATQELADAWLAQQLVLKTFGKPERWVRNNPLDPENAANIAAALDTRVIVDRQALPEVVDEETQEITFAAQPELNHTEYKLAAEYVVEILDITAQVQTAKDIEEALAYLASTDWYIIRQMDSGEACPQEVKDLRAAARAKVISQ